jgi:hypothetical protein
LLPIPAAVLCGRLRSLASIVTQYRGIVGKRIRLGSQQIGPA